MLPGGDLTEIGEKVFPSTGFKKKWNLCFQTVGLSNWTVCSSHRLAVRIHEHKRYPNSDIVTVDLII